MFPLALSPGVGVPVWPTAPSPAPSGCGECPREETEGGHRGQCPGLHQAGVCRSLQCRGAPGGTAATPRVCRHVCRRRHVRGGRVARSGSDAVDAVGIRTTARGVSAGRRGPVYVRCRPLPAGPSRPCEGYLWLPWTGRRWSAESELPAATAAAAAATAAPAAQGWDGSCVVYGGFVG